MEQEQWRWQSGCLKCFKTKRLSYLSPLDSPCIGRFFLNLSDFLLCLTLFWCSVPLFPFSLSSTVTLGPLYLIPSTHATSYNGYASFWLSHDLIHTWSTETVPTQLKCMDIYIYYTPRCQLIRTHVNKYRPGEALDIQSELIFANGMVHLSKEWNFDTPTTLFSWATPLLPVTATPEAIFLFTWHHTFNIPTYKIIAMCIECVTVLRANNTRVKHEYRMSGSSLEG